MPDLAFLRDEELTLAWATAVRARIQADLGDSEAAAATYREAISLIEGEEWLGKGDQMLAEFTAALEALESRPR